MIFIFVFVTGIATLFPPFIGWFLFNFFSSSPEPSPIYKCFWALLSGVALTYTVNFINVTYHLFKFNTSTFIAYAFDQILPYLVLTAAICIVIAALSSWIHSAKQIKQQSILDIAAQKNIANEEIEARFKAMDLSLSELKLKARDEIAHDRSVLAKDRQQFDQQQRKCNENFESKKRAYIEENNGLQASRDRLKEEIRVKDEIIHWLREGNNLGALERAEKKLRNLKKRKSYTSNYQENSEESDGSIA